MIFIFFYYVSKCGNKLAVHGPDTTCRRALLSQQNVVFSRSLEQTFQNTEISHKIWIPEFSWKSRGPGAQAQHSMAATSQSRQPLFWWIFHSAVNSTVCCLPGTEAECPLPLIFAIANCISRNSEIFTGNYLSSKWQNKTLKWLNVSSRMCWNNIDDSLHLFLSIFCQVL